MAKKLKLVPADWPVEEEKRKLDDMSAMLPPRYQTRGKLLLQMLEGKITIDENNRVLYEDGPGSHTKGSHIIDLLKYFISPKHLHIQRPEDSMQFAKLLLNAGIPRSAVSRNLEVSTVNWLSFDS